MGALYIRMPTNKNINKKGISTKNHDNSLYPALHIRSNTNVQKRM